MHQQWDENGHFRPLISELVAHESFQEYRRSDMRQVGVFSLWRSRVEGRIDPGGTSFLLRNSLSDGALGVGKVEVVKSLRVDAPETSGLVDVSVERDSPVKNSEHC